MSIRPITKALAALADAEALLEEAYNAICNERHPGDPSSAAVLHAYRKAADARQDTQYLLRPEDN